MIQIVPDEPRPLGRRERNRLNRTRDYLRTAIAIVGQDGLDGLTMQRVADELDCAVGTIYSYFPSKSALVAEVQREAIERITSSYVVIRADLEHQIVREGDPKVAALARAVLMGRFWIATPDTFPEEALLMQLLMSESRGIISPEDAVRVLPAATRHLDQGRMVLDAAVQADALDPADAMERVVSWLSAVNGVAQMSRLADHDEELFDGPRLATQLNHDLLVGWGADRALLTGAATHIERLARRGPLAPPLTDTTVTTATETP